MNELSVADPQVVADADLVGDSPIQDQPLDHELVVEELLVEEISIDGMCGVY